MIERGIGIDNRRFVNNVQARRGQTRKGVICLLHVKVMLASSGVLAFASAFESAEIIHETRLRHRRHQHNLKHSPTRRSITYPPCLKRLIKTEGSPVLPTPVQKILVPALCFEIATMDLVQGARTLHSSRNKDSRIVEYAIQALHIYNTADPYLRPIRRFIFQTQRQVYPILLPYLNTAANLAHKSPAIITVGILLLFLLIAMQVLNFIRRLMVWWFKLVMRIVFWTLVVLLISAVWQRGVERTVGDLVGWGQELSEVWWREYRRWEGYQNQGKVQGRYQGSTMGRTNARASWR
jgi:uncharacterized protein YggT (Ycf19 family)